MRKKLLNVSIFIISAIALIQLAMSQIHIKTITKVFAREIGFYFFMYIIFGIVTLFNAINSRKRNNNLLLSVCTIIEVGVGIKYIQLLLNDVKEGNILGFGDIVFPLYMAIVSIILYAICTILIMISKMFSKKKQEKEV